MAGTSLLALLDDIATLLDDISLLTKNAASKTVGVLGDDLALNAEQVTGVRAEREIPVVWAVAKGSFVNKLILVPGALVLSYFLPAAITPLLMLGGAYLCFEGFEKVAHKLLHSQEAEDEKHAKKLSAIVDEKVDLVAFEKEKIKGAIRTDFILSGEIVVIALGTVQSAPFITRAAVVSTLAFGLTVGVYALVAGIVKIDDAGVHLMGTAPQAALSSAKRALGRALLWFAPRFLKTLSVLGTAAMFLVGGGILAHGTPPLARLIHGAEHVAEEIPSLGTVLGALTPSLLNGLVGIVAGGLLVMLYLGVQKLRPSQTPGSLD